MKDTKNGLVSASSYDWLETTTYSELLLTSLLLSPFGLFLGLAIHTRHQTLRNKKNKNRPNNVNNTEQRRREKKRSSKGKKRDKRKIIIITIMRKYKKRQRLSVVRFHGCGKTRQPRLATRQPWRQLFTSAAMQDQKKKKKKQIKTLL